MPVMPIPIAAPRRSRAPRASAPATTDETAPWPWMTSGATSARIVFASFEYTTAPPLKNALDPPCAVRTVARRPPVQDSATATVVLRRTSRAWSGFMRSSSSARVGARLAGTEHESDARNDGQRDGGVEQEQSRRPQQSVTERRRGDESGRAPQLQRRLELSVGRGRKGALGASARLDREPLPKDDDRERPPRRETAKHERRERPDREDLVRQRIEHRASRRDLVPGARYRPIDGVGDGREREEPERREVGLGRGERDEDAHGDREDRASKHEERRCGHCTRKVRSTTSPGRPRL